MAQRTQVLLIDDLDGSSADETLNFGLDGAAYEIDLSADNAGLLRKALADYVAAGRRASSSRLSSRRRPPALPTSRPSVPGHARTATRSTTAAGSPPTSSRRTRLLTEAALKAARAPAGAVLASPFAVSESFVPEASREQ